LNLRNKKWLISGSYNPHLNNIQHHLKSIGNNLDSVSSKYEHFILLGDFNAEMDNNSMQEFCETYDLKALIKEPTCYKNINNPTTIDHILTNRPKSFCNSKTVETSLSDFHKLTITVLKSYFRKNDPKIIKYRNYKHYSNEAFREEIKMKLSCDNQEMNIENFRNTVVNTVNKHAPWKIKYVRNNEGVFMNKTLKKAIMTRTRLLNKFRANKTIKNNLSYKKQRNACVNLLRKAKKSYYNEMNVKCVTDNKLFWKSIKPNFSEKGHTTEKITLVNNGNIISNDKEVANAFNTFFQNSMHDLKLFPPKEMIQEDSHIDDAILKAIHKYELHPSIMKIKEKMADCCLESFSFREVNESEVRKKISSLKGSKSHQQNDIPTKILQDNIDIFCPYIKENFVDCINECEFPDILKHADITPIHKKDTKCDTKNYRPISILPNLSKIYERCIYDQLYVYFENILSKYQFGFRKGYSAQHCLISMIEKLKRHLDKKDMFGMILTDLSKAFDCIPHDLLLAKLNAFGLDMNSLKIISSYLSNRKQRVRINNAYSDWSELPFGVPQGSILGPLLFNIFTCDIFLCISGFDIANYADDNTPFCGGSSIEIVLQKLTEISEKLFSWFRNNCMTANPEKSHLMLSKPDQIKISVCGKEIQNSKCEKLLGILIDNNLNFQDHVSMLCKKASQKLQALSRVSKYMNHEQTKLLVNAFVTSHFSYCPLVWMMHSHKMNNRINIVHERALRVIYKDYISSYSELLKKDGSVTIHQRNLRLLAIEIFKANNKLGPELINNIFKFVESNYNLRNRKATSTIIRTTNYGIETLTYLAPKIWKEIPDSCKKATSLNQFKREIQEWIPKNCPCRICKTYIQGIGYI